MSLSLSEQKALAIIPHITGGLSLFGSSSILYDIWSNRRLKLQRPYYRILLGMCVIDMITSISLGLSTWPVPRDEVGVYGNVGNTQTCTAQGFFSQLILGSPLYNCMLATYYLLLGKFHFTEEQIAKRFERYMHFAALLPTVGIALAGLPLTLYNNANLWCWIAAWPPGSESFNGHESEEIECLRGHGSWLYRWVFFYAPIWLIIVVVTIMMTVLTISIRSEERKSIVMVRALQEQAKENRTDMESNGDPSHENGMPFSQVEVFNLERSRRMFHQATFYVLVFYLTWWAPTINRLIQMTTGDSYYFFMVATAIFAPLQGFFNFIVYRHGACVA